MNQINKPAETKAAPVVAAPVQHDAAHTARPVVSDITSKIDALLKQKQGGTVEYNYCRACGRLGHNKNPVWLPDSDSIVKDALAGMNRKAPDDRPGTLTRKAFDVEANGFRGGDGDGGGPEMDKRVPGVPWKRVTTTNDDGTKTIEITDNTGQVTTTKA